MSYDVDEIITSIGYNTPGTELPDLYLAHLNKKKREKQASIASTGFAKYLTYLEKIDPDDRLYCKYRVRKLLKYLRGIYEKWEQSKGY